MVWTEARRLSREGRLAVRVERGLLAVPKGRGDSQTVAGGERADRPAGRQRAGAATSSGRGEESCDAEYVFIQIARLRRSALRLTSQDKVLTHDELVHLVQLWCISETTNIAAEHNAQ
jgi:hypothetical protein